MCEANIDNLKQQIEKLIDSRAQLLVENKLLSKKLLKIVQERALLLSSKEKIASKLANILNRLKAEIS